MTDLAALLSNYFPPPVLLTAVVVWMIAKLDNRVKDAKATGVRAHKRIDKIEEEKKL
jgi:hypothetical protein